jgi:subtilase family serine protease
MSVRNTIVDPYGSPTIRNDLTVFDDAFGLPAPPSFQKVAGQEYLWADGGGRSAVFGRPAYQNPVRGITGDERGVPDIAMSASISGAVLLYESFTGAPGLWGPGGTSAASPCWQVSSRSPTSTRTPG